MAIINDPLGRKKVIDPKKPPAWLGTAGGGVGRKKPDYTSGYGIGGAPVFNPQEPIRPDGPAVTGPTDPRRGMWGNSNYHRPSVSAPITGQQYVPAGLSPRQQPTRVSDFSARPDIVKRLVNLFNKDANQSVPPDGPNTFIAGGGDAYRNNDQGAYWMPRNLPQYPTGTFFGGGGTKVAGALDGWLPTDDGGGGGDDGGGYGGFGTRYSGWGGGGGYGGYDYNYIPPWLMGLYQLNYKG